MALDLPRPEEPSYGTTVRKTLIKIDGSIHRDSVGNTEISSPTGTIKVDGALEADGGLNVTGALNTSSVAASGTVSGSAVSATGAVSGASVAATGQVSGDRLTVNGGSPSAGQLKGSTVLASGAVTAGSVSAGSGTISTSGTVDAGTVDVSGNITGASGSQVVLGGDTVMKRGTTDRMDFDSLVRFNDSGGLQIGSDTNLYRAGTNHMKTDDMFEAGGNLITGGAIVAETGSIANTLGVSGALTVGGAANISGGLNHDGSTVGFYGVTPATRLTINLANYGGSLTQSQINRAVQDIFFGMERIGLIVDNVF